MNFQCLNEACSQEGSLSESSEALSKEVREESAHI